MGTNQITRKREGLKTQRRRIWEPNYGFWEDKMGWHSEYKMIWLIFSWMKDLGKGEQGSLWIWWQVFVSLRKWLWLLALHDKVMNTLRRTWKGGPSSHGISINANSVVKGGESLRHIEVYPWRHPEFFPGIYHWCVT